MKQVLFTLSGSILSQFISPDELKIVVSALVSIAGIIWTGKAVAKKNERSKETEHENKD